MTIINVPLRSKMERIKYDRCQVEKTVWLPHSEFEHFRMNLMESQDFIKEALPDLIATNDNVRHCIMVLDLASDDGILVDPQGYDYARYSAYIPNARQITQLKYKSLDEFDDRMRSAVEDYVRLALEEQKDGRYSFYIDDVNREYDNNFFDSDLFVEMIGERVEFSDMEYFAGEFLVNINPKCLPYENKKLYNEDIQEKCARHVLWMYDLDGGERADFSDCIVKDVIFLGSDLSGAVFDNAYFKDCSFESACLMNSSMRGAKFENCSFYLSTAEEVNAENAIFGNCDFSEADLIESNFKNAKFNNCDFSCISIEKSCIEGADFVSTIPDAEEIQRCFEKFEAFDAYKSNSLDQAPLT